MIHAFPKIFAIGSNYTQRLFDGPVEITEKVDGSQFNWGLKNGELHIRSKGATIVPDAPPKMFARGVAWVQSKVGMLPDNTFFHGEYLDKPKHNILEYARVPKCNFVLFAMSSPDGTFEASYQTLTEWAMRLGCDAIPLLQHGIVTDVEELKRMLNYESYLGGPKIEGFVVKNYEQNILVGGQLIKPLCGKYVSGEFKEKHKVGWVANTPKGGLEAILESYKTEARWHKAVQHLRDKGLLTNSPKDIGALIKEIQTDIVTEEKEEIKRQLWRVFHEQVLRTAIGGFPDWYKKQLLEGAFNNG